MDRAAIIGGTKRELSKKKRPQAEKKGPFKKKDACSDVLKGAVCHILQKTEHNSIQKYTVTLPNRASPVDV